MTWVLRLLYALLFLPLHSIAAPLDMSVGGIKGQFGYTETELEIVMQDILNVKLGNFGVKVNLKLYPNKTKLDEAYNSEEIDAIFSDPVVALTHEKSYNKGAFLNLHFKESPSKDVLVVLASKKSGIKSLKQLKNKKVTFYADNRLEQIFLETALLRNKLGTLESFFSKNLTVKNGHVALLDVFFGKSDVTVVPLEQLKVAGELNPQLKKNLVVLAQSEPMCTRVVMIRGHPRYSKVFDTFMANGKFESNTHKKLHFMVFEPSSFDALDSIRLLIRENTKLKKR